MQPPQAERFPYGHQFLDEPVDRPERLIDWPLRPAGTELVVEDHGPGAREVAQVLEVVMSHARAAMQAQDRDAGPV